MPVLPREPGPRGQVAPAVAIAAAGAPSARSGRVSPKPIKKNLTLKVKGRIPDNIHVKMVPVSPTMKKPRAVYDWPGLFTAYRAAVRLCATTDLKQWCVANDLADKYNMVRTNFRELGRQIAGDTLALSAPNAAARVARIVDSEDDELALKASTAVMDRVGLSPQQVAVTINNQNIQAVQIPPLLREDYSRDVKQFIDAVEARDDE